MPGSAASLLRGTGVAKLTERAAPTNFLARMREVISAPWTLTGPASSLENLPSLTTADNYRPFAPGSPPAHVTVPHARPETTFDIKYFPRERRRVHSPLWNVGAVKTTQFAVTPAASAALLAAAAAPAPGVRAPLQEWHTGKGVRAVPLLEDVNQGYT